MALTQFENQPKEELSFVEIATAILDEKRDTMPFSDIVAEIQSFLGLSDDDMKARLAQFYTDLNVDGSFISLGNNVWGLRAWYPIDAIDENIHEIEEVDDPDAPKRKKPAKKVNVFALDGADDDVIDYNDDDPEDDDFVSLDDDEAVVEEADDSTVEEEIDDSAEVSLEDNLAELTGDDDLDDLSDGDEER